MFGFKFTLPFVLKVVYNIFVNLIPGLAILIPLDSLMRIIEAVQSSLDHQIVVDWKFSDMNGLMKFMLNLMEVAVNKSEKEQLEAIYALLVYLTTLEDFVSEEEFVSKGMTVKECLPAGNVFPDEEMRKACDLYTLPA